mmetsp:Transcript_16920/g.46741  ORF Transcript_16920/g.46741 Transcript_16920/m.46741 type:complete len:210 (+) Transcript_16920:1109-1738(+)
MSSTRPVWCVNSHTLVRAFVSHSITRPLLQPAAMRALSLLVVTQLRASANLLNKEFRTSTTVLHTWTRPTLSHVMILDSTGLFAYEQNRMGSFWASIMRICLPSSAFHTRMVQSSPPVTMDVPSSFTAHEYTAPLWPSSVMHGSKVSVSQIMALPSPPAVTMRDACFMKVACITAPPWQCTQALLPLRGSTNTRLGNGTLSMHHTRTWM